MRLTGKVYNVVTLLGTSLLLALCTIWAMSIKGDHGNALFFAIVSAVLGLAGMSTMVNDCRRLWISAGNDGKRS